MATKNAIQIYTYKNYNTYTAMGFLKYGSKNSRAGKMGQ